MMGMGDLPGEQDFLFCLSFLISHFSVHSLPHALSQERASLFIRWFLSEASLSGLSLSSGTLVSPCKTGHQFLSSRSRLPNTPKPQSSSPRRLVTDGSVSTDNPPRSGGLSTERPSGCGQADQAMTLWWWQDSPTSGRWNGVFAGDVWPLALLRTLRLLHEFQLKCHLVREIFLPLRKWAIPSLSTHHPLSLHS